MTKADILIVEDDSIVAEDIKISLKKMGYSVIGIVASGEEALIKIKTQQPDLILMDIMLEGEMNGTQAVGQVREMYNIPVVYVTAYTNEDILERAKITEPYGYIIKPFEDRELSTAVEIALYKHKIETKLKESEEWLSTTLNSIGDAVIATDAKGDITFLNPEAQSVTGWSQEEAVGKPLADVFNIVNELTGKKAENPVEKVFRENETVGLANHTILVTKDGNEIPINDSGAPIRNEKGEITGVVLVFSDITDRRIAEKALSDRDEKLRAILASVPDLMIVLSSEGHYMDIFTGSPDLLIAPAEKLLGKTIHDVLPADSSQAIQNVIDQALHTRESQYIEYNLEVDDLKKWFGARGIAFRYKDSDCVLWSARDITERKQAESDRNRMEAQLQQAQKMEAIGTLAGGIAHDFNNLLSPLVGYAEILKDDLAPDHPFQPNADAMLDSALRARDLVKQILTFSRKSDFTIKPIKLQAVIREAVKLLRSSITKTIEINNNIDSDCGLVNADPTKVHQVIMNLATNAYHAMEEGGGRLSIALDQVRIEQDSSEVPDLLPGSYARLIVGDTGTGMEKDVIGKVFDPYFTTKETGKGTGLGLSVVHGIVKEFGGVIQICSEPGKRTDIHVYLPIIESKVTKSDENTGPVIGGNEKILLIDDEEAVANMEQQLLERLGYNVITRIGSIEALEAFKSNPDKFDLIITDMAMPNMTGIQLSQEIKKIKPTVPIIICTGFSDQITDEKCQALGLQGYVLKPVIVKELAGIIRKILDTSEGS